MVQIGNFHIGKADTVQEPTITIQEASCLWDFLVARYKCLEETKVYHNIAKDLEFKSLLQTGITTILEKQISLIEKEIQRYKIPMPSKPPVDFKNLQDNIEIRDEFLFRQIFEGCQNFIETVARISKTMLTNDSLREIFMNFLKEELFYFDKLCKYAKLKGWIEISPTYKN